MRIERQPAFVLHARAWRETSLLLEVFTREHGRIGVIAQGVRGPRKQALRAALQPFVPISVDLLHRSELARLITAEPSGPAAGLLGDRLMAGFYVNELLLRLSARGDPGPDLFDRYHAVLVELAGETPLSWLLRRFERDLLERLGFAPPWRETADGDRIVPEQRYRLDAEVGPVATPSGGVAGRALLALADDRMPEPTDLRALRDALRGLIASHLDGRELVSWGVLARLPSTESGGRARRSISDDPSDQ